MQATCPRCGNSHIAHTEGPAIPCPSCGYTALVISAAPPAGPEDGEPARWGAALLGCVAVSALVMVCALTLARLAEAEDHPKPLVGHAVAEEPCESAEPVCVDPSLWAADQQD